MTEPHRIRLRGGWTIAGDRDQTPWNLPCTGREIAAAGECVRLIRRFNHPQKVGQLQPCRLVMRRVAGVTQIEIDGQPFVPAWPVTDHPEAGFEFELPATPNHVVSLTIDRNDAAEAEEWGLIWLEISEPDQAS